MLADRTDRIAALSRVLRHGDPAQIAFQSNEIAGDLVYLQHGVQVEPGDTVIDAGGNLGAASAFFATQCEAGAVHAFEPVPETYDLLERNLEGIPACSTHRLGLAEAAGQKRVTAFSGGDSVLSGVEADPERIREMLAVAARNLGLDEEASLEMAAERCVPHEVECRFTDLSGFLHERGIEEVALLKVDVEGAEVDVLRGIAEEDWPRIRQVVAETHSDRLLEEFTGRLARRSFRVEVEQSPDLADTPVRFVYATR